MVVVCRMEEKVGSWEDSYTRKGGTDHNCLRKSWLKHKVLHPCYGIVDGSPDLFAREIVQCYLTKGWALESVHCYLVIYRPRSAVG